MKKSKTKTPARSKPADVPVDVDLIGAMARPIVERDRFLRPVQVGHLLRAAYPNARWSASELRKTISETFETVIDLPL